MPNAVITPQRVSLSTLPPLSLYIHLPWCVKKCPYCDFNSHETREPITEAAYVKALLQDLELALPLIWGRQFQSVFFGGGTPSLFSAESIDAVLSGVRALVPLAHFAEISLEANPGTAEAQKFMDFRAAGINRLSLGIQSFNPAALLALGRIHDDHQARLAIEIALRHFDNINLDLMYALPQQNLAEALDDIDIALSYAPQHISAYHLTVEPNTLFHKHPPSLPDDDASFQMQSAIEEKLSAAGFAHYETSAFAKPAYTCRHNVNYWTFGDYLGIGAGAHSKLSRRDAVVRQSRLKQPAAYMEKVALGEHLQTEQTLSVHDLAFEFMMNALRLTDGFAVPLFTERTGLPLKRVEGSLLEAEAKGLVRWDAQRVAPTARGRHFLNDLLQLFLTT